MDTALDAVLELFTWVGLGGAVVLGVVAVVLWAVDGTWLPAEAVVDREGDGTVVRWFDGDGDANSARATDDEASVIGQADTVAIWYRHGWHDRMRLTRRPPGLRTVVRGAVALAVLAAVATIVSWVLLFVRG
ncbi:hypothetical protein [Microbacterium sp.]|uniref:hypothetical protein n=1 Tax=Microbacterium sp. TaxID=51671 RepID=UPI0039E6D5D3